MASEQTTLSLFLLSQLRTEQACYDEMRKAIEEYDQQEVMKNMVAFEFSERMCRAKINDLKKQIFELSHGEGNKTIDTNPNMS